MASLATRCTACGTVFRVVQDQLRVAGGMVRCGRCGEVFNAAQALIDLTMAAVTATEAPSEPATPPTAEAASMPALDFSAVESMPAILAVVDVPHPLPRVEAGTKADPASSPDSGPESGAANEAELQAEADEMPSFVRRADRAQCWRQPRVRAALAAVAALGVLGLAAQLVHTYRDQLAARLPGARPALVAACSALGCRVDAARAIDKLAVESSGLVRVEKSDVYKLQVTLRNRGEVALALPALDLTLIDGAGKAMVRRVLRATDLGVTETTLAAGRELALQATLQAATEPVVGYTIELFYP